MSRLFRKSFLVNLQEQDDLELVVPRRSSPVFWPLMFTISSFIAAFVAWCFLAQVPLTIEARGIVLPLGGVREVVSLGEGVVMSRQEVDNRNVRAGDILLRLYHPTSDAAYNDERRTYLARMAMLNQERNTFQHEHERKLSELSLRRDSVGRNLDFLSRIDEAFNQAMTNFLSTEAVSLETQRKSIAALKENYEQLQEGILKLQEKGHLTFSSYMQFMHQQNSALQSLSDISLKLPRSKLEEQRMLRELSELKERIATDVVMHQELAGDMAASHEQMRIKAHEFDLQELEARQTLLELERQLWVNSNIFTPYDGEVVALKKTIGQTVGRNEAVALMNMSTQHRQKMLVLSPRAMKGSLELSLQGRNVVLQIDRLRKKDVYGDLPKALEALAPGQGLNVRISGDRAVISAPPDRQALLDQLLLVNFDLRDQVNVPVFAMWMIVGDEWKSGEMVNVALLRAEDAKRVQAGATARVKPDYEPTLIGSQLEAKVASVSKYTTSSIEAEALVGSAELARVIAGDSSGTAMILRFDRDLNGHLRWRGGEPSVPLSIGTTTKTRIDVETLPPIKVLIPFVANLFN